MVVDDDAVLLIFAAETLKAIGFEIVEAESGEEALEILEEQVPDLVLLDVGLPGMDGYEVCETMRRRPDMVETPILIMTGKTDGTSIARAFEVGASDFIRKPLDWKLIQHRVDSLLDATTVSRDLESTLHDLQQSRTELEAAHEIGRTGSWEIDLESGQVLWSSELHRLVGTTPNASAPNGLEDMTRLLPEEERPLFQKVVRSVAETGSPKQLDHRLIDATGKTRFISQRIAAAEGLPGQRLLRGTLQDVTERHEAEAKAEYFANVDAVTGLPNRRFLHDRLEQLLVRCRNHGSSLAILCIDLDRFNRINQALGFGVGDELLCEVGNKLLTVVRSTEYVGCIDEPPDVARIAGNEFSVVLSGLVHEATARQAATEILNAFDEPFVVGDQRIPLSASVGISTFNVTASEGDADSLLSRASLAMKWAKQQGGRSYRLFDPSESSSVEMQLALESDLAAALQEEELVLEYQPQCDAVTGYPIAVEALVRWNHPRLGRLMPGDFIPVAESSGMVGALGEWVLRESCRQIAAWDAAGLPPLRVGANVSSVQFEQGRVVDMVRAALDAHDVAPERLEVEITETALLGDGADVQRTCEALQKLGVSIALDDFGTGYSSLSHLFRFQIDVLKIDRSFTAEIRDSERARAIIAAIIAMSDRLGVTVIAEGVEQPEESAYMRDEGCHLLQGFGICRPAPPDEIEVWVKKRVEDLQEDRAGCA